MDGSFWSRLFLSLMSLTRLRPRSTWLAVALGGVGIIDAKMLPGAALPALLLVLAGFWAAGACLAGVVTFGELLVRSLRREPAARGAAP